ncbi:carboxypeptidase M32 [Parasulfitobacter algicola]|uniref:Metal-dependent carboxypeptidase n=1 Tax=Parasulfitobacter algicola TaxID=2614809 RepID=A0ABX2IU61_9RHOB|nr:carboxypeptidase M32 [Sulfitobacter algicola]NSX53904.1 carboxypeptidase M32 [Sulfitobacter algicola]
MSAYTSLMAYQRETEALSEIAGRLGWDQETMMPRGASEQRSEEMAAIESVLHARRTDPRIGDWLASAKPSNAVKKAQLRHIRRSFERSQKVPAKLAVEIARATSVAQGIWAKAREANSFKDFAPTLEQIVSLKCEEGAALADGGNVYDALLDDYEPGATTADLEDMFDALRPRLVALRDQIKDADQPPVLQGNFDEAGQLKLSAKLAEVFGYDLTRGRIDKAVHPFSSGSGQDVRITTRTVADDPFNCFYSTIHEVGHATYEQQIDPAYLLTPVGAGASMGIHESQSRIYENQLGRSRAFTGWLHGQMIDTFGDFGIEDPNIFYRAVNAVQDGFIRTEADEVQYNLHILMRFDLERAMMSGGLAVGDLEVAWNDRFLADFGFAVDMPANGCLQDVHWSVGLFGYFPTYTLGNVYAGCLFEALQAAVPDLDAQLSQGNLTAATIWLRDNLQRHGGLYEPRDLIKQATGADPTEKPLLNYLEAKFLDIYNI